MVGQLTSYIMLILKHYVTVTAPVNFTRKKKLCRAHNRASTLTTKLHGFIHNFMKSRVHLKKLLYYLKLIFHTT